MNQADPKNISDADIAQLDKSEELKYRDGNFQTNLSSALTKHSRKHKSKRLQCQHCDYTTTNSGNLKAHSRKHTGEKIKF